MIINKEAILKGPDYDAKVEYHHNTDKRLRFDNQWVVGNCFNLSTGKKIKETKVWIPEGDQEGYALSKYSIWMYLMEFVERQCSFDEPEMYFDDDGHLHLGTPEENHGY